MSTQTQTLHQDFTIFDDYDRSLQPSLSPLQPSDYALVPIGGFQTKLYEDYHSNINYSPIFTKRRKETQPLITTFFSPTVEKKILIFEFFNNYFTASPFLNVAFTGYNIVKFLRQFQVWRKNQARKSIPTTDAQPSLPDTIEQSQKSTSLTPEQEDIIEKLSESIILNRTSPPTNPQDFETEKKELMGTLKDLVNDFVTRPCVNLYGEINGWIDLIDEINNTPTEEVLPEEIGEDLFNSSLTFDWVEISADELNEELMELNLSDPVDSQTLNEKIGKLLNNLRLKLISALSLDQATVWKSRMRYIHTAGVLFGLSPEILLAVAVVEGLLLLKAYREK